MMRTASGVEYELTRKPVKNLNLRVHPDGTVRVSAPRQVPLAEVDRFVAGRTAWIEGARGRLAAYAGEAEAAREAYTDEECLAAFAAVSDRIYPLFAHLLPEKPELRVRWMKSRWGVCYPAKNRITLNKQLMGKPISAVEYVVLHEYVHFLHPNHQAGFHSDMARLMSDYRERRKLLKTGGFG